MKYVVIGAGISGLSIAQLLSEHNNVTVFEADSRPGGMVKCDRVNGHLFHRTGGHVFNTKRQDVQDWFWKKFDKDIEFTKVLRNSSINLLSKDFFLPYPIENYTYLLNAELQKQIISDWLQISNDKKPEYENFSDFLLNRFGRTLYSLYFEPYNMKVWRRSLTNVSLEWLEGKLPMPTVEEMIYNNFNHVDERYFVHSSFYYPQKGGSQFIVDRLADGLNIQSNIKVQSIAYNGKQWLVDDQCFDKVIFCGNIKQIPSLLDGIIDLSYFVRPIEELESHGTTSVLCEIDSNPYSWIYLPSKNHESHRIICTGNFSSTNNAEGKMTATIEFTDEISVEDIKSNLNKLPLHPKYITHNYEKYTYPIQDNKTREMISALENLLSSNGFYLLGRFAQWEYYNMDVAMGAALDLYNNKLVRKS